MRRLFSFGEGGEEDVGGAWLGYCIKVLGAWVDCEAVVSWTFLRYAL